MITAPAISVIIPMYNAEKFIGDCLESILNQTFQDFEVIVVDDCSTDSSFAVVESYAPKFNGRLKLSRMKKNSGSAGTPRNTGLFLSRGEYVFFVDADDLITVTGLEELYTLAKNFDAEVVYCESYYVTDAEFSEVVIHCPQAGGASVDKPTFETDDFSERLNRIKQYLFVVTAGLKLIKRNLLLEHEIFFPHIKNREDDIWTWNLVFHTKKFLRVPNIIYICRLLDNSITRTKKTPEQEINFWINPIILGLKTLDEIMSRVEFFQQNPQWRYAMLFYFVEVSFMFLHNNCAEEPPVVVYESIREKFSDALGENDVLIPLLCSFITAQQQLIANQRQRIAELEQTLEEKF
ncbi:MAG: glycosyltransferase family 2 protein [Selenomonadaceae bacterium]|nr:glycosyltransferase family 2 protein [Selenomonadaceae bacterium]